MQFQQHFYHFMIMKKELLSDYEVHHAKAKQKKKIRNRQYIKTKIVGCGW